MNKATGKYTIAIEMLNKWLIKSGRPMRRWRRGASQWLSLQLCPMGPESTESCRAWRPLVDGRAVSQSQLSYSVILLLSSRSPDTTRLLSSHRITRRWPHSSRRNVPQVLHSLLTAAPGESELPPSPPVVLPLLPLLPQLQLGRGGVAPAGPEVQGAK